MWSPDIFSPKVFQGKLYFGEEHDTVVIACFLFKQVDKKLISFTLLICNYHVINN